MDGYLCGLTLMVPLIVRPWTLQWYLNSPSWSNLTGFDDFPGSTAPLSNVLPSSSEIAVCDVRDSLVQITESPMLSCSSFGSKLMLFMAILVGFASASWSPTSLCEGLKKTAQVSANPDKRSEKARMMF